ncbi:MAG: DUF6265 family protein [bacterium]|nr:DUF6265 family protein [bacterium]
MKFIPIILLVVSCNQAVSQDPVYKLVGEWQVEGKQTFETWELVDGKLVGEGYKIKDGQKFVSETLSISNESGDWTYSATVPNQNEGRTIPFELNREVADKLSFENLSHDFPKKIQYQFLNKKEIFVSVLGDEDKGFSFKMIKQD